MKRIEASVLGVEWKPTDFLDEASELQRSWQVILWVRMMVVVVLKQGG